MTTPENKKSKTDEMSDELDSSPIDYERTEVDDVFECNELPPPKRAREELNDDDDPVILILTKKTRELFFDMVKKQKDSTKVIQKDVGTQTDSVVTQTDSDHEIRMMDDNGCNTVNFDMNNAEQFKEDYTKVIDGLQSIQRQFRDSQLKADIDNSSDLHTFREIRKTISKMHVHGSKMMKNIEKATLGDRESLFQVETNVKPSFIEKETTERIISDLDNTVKTINAKLFNVSLENCRDEIKETFRIMGCTNPILIAKAWRTAQKNPNVEKEYRLRQNYRSDRRPDNTRQRYSNRSDDRQRTFYNQNYRQRQNNYERDDRYRRYDSDRHRRQFRDDDKPHYQNRYRNRDYQQRSYRYDETEFPRLQRRRDSSDTQNEEVFRDEYDQYPSRRRHY